MAQQITQPAASVNVSEPARPARAAPESSASMWGFVIAGVVGFGLGILVMLAVMLVLDSPNGIAERTAAAGQAEQKRIIADGHIKQGELRTEIDALKAKLEQQRTSFANDRAKFEAWYQKSEEIGYEAVRKALRELVLTFPNLTTRLLTEHLGRVYAVRADHSRDDDVRRFAIGDGTVIVCMKLVTESDDDSPVSIVSVVAIANSAFEGGKFGDICRRVREVVTTEPFLKAEKEWFIAALAAAQTSDSVVSKQFGILRVNVQANKVEEGLLYRITYHPAEKTTD